MDLRAFSVAIGNAIDCASDENKKPAEVEVVVYDESAPTGEKQYRLETVAYGSFDPDGKGSRGSALILHIRSVK
jgi:hypothetical protein